LADRSLNCATDDLDTMLLVAVVGLDIVKSLGSAQQGHATAGQDAFFNGGTGCVQRVVDAVLALLHLNFSRAADADHGNATSKLGETLLQLLAVVVGGGLLDLCLDLADASFDLVLLAGTIDDGGVFLLDDNLLGATEHFQRDVLKLDAKVFADRGATGQDGDVFEHGLAAVTEAGGFHGCHLEAAAQLVDDERCERFAFDIFSDDQQRLARLDHGLKHRQHGLQVGELLFVDQDIGVLELHAHALLVGDEVGREVPAVELHAFDDFQFGLGRLGFLDGNDTLVADLLHRLGEKTTDLGFAIGGDGADLRNRVVLGDLACLGLQFGHDGVHGLVDAALQVHWVNASGNGLGAFPDHRLGENGCGRGAVASQIIG